MRWDRIKNAVRHPITEYQVSKAKRLYRRHNPRCAITGLSHSLLMPGRAVDVHHIVPVHVDPARACDLTNMISLTRDLHFAVAHRGDWRDYDPAIRGTVHMLTAVLEAAATTAEI